MSTERQEFKQLNEPALLLTAQTTVPVLTTLLFTLSLAILGFIVTVEDSKWPKADIYEKITTKDVALWLISISALLFLITVGACVKSHAWDYYTLPKERRDAEGLSEAPHYTVRCENHAWAWYKLAIWGFYVGTWLLMAGVAAYFYPKSILIPILTLAYIIFPLLVKLRYKFDDQSDSHIDWWLNFFLRKPQGQSPPALTSEYPFFMVDKPVVNPVKDEEYEFVFSGKYLAGISLNLKETAKGKLHLVTTQPSVDSDSSSASAKIKVLKECRSGTYGIEVKNGSQENYKSPVIRIRVLPQEAPTFTGMVFGEDGKAAPPTTNSAEQRVVIIVSGSNLNGANLEPPAGFKLENLNNSLPDQLKVTVVIPAGAPAKDNYVFNISNTSTQKVSFNFPVKAA